ncbi:MAG: NTP transferase domain-containing protein [Novosphingobium sp.]
MSLAAIVLAAGAGRRFGGGKLAALFRGEPLVCHAIRAARAAPVDRVIVVCSPELEIGDWRGEPRIEIVRLVSPELSASLKAGIAAAADTQGAFIFLGDMPLVPHDLAGRLAAVLGTNFAAVPRHAGRNGHPVLLSARAFAPIAGLQGDEGAGRLINAREDIAFLDSADEGVLLDIDRAEDMARLEKRGEA